MSRSVAPWLILKSTQQPSANTTSHTSAANSAILPNMRFRTYHDLGGARTVVRFANVWPYAHRVANIWPYAHRQVRKCLAIRAQGRKCLAMRARGIIMTAFGQDPKTDNNPEYITRPKARSSCRSKISHTFAIYLRIKTRLASHHREAPNQEGQGLPHSVCS
jgi:hypothetical protein